MIRQIVVEQDQGKPNQVSVLLTSGDLPDEVMARLGARITRLTRDDQLGHARGNIDGIRWRWLPMDAETPGLEYHTLRVERHCLMYRDVVELEQMVEAANARAAVSPEIRLPAPHPCDRVPWWLWPVAAAVVIGLIAAGAR